MTKNNYSIRRDRFKNKRKVIEKCSDARRRGTVNKNNMYCIR